MFRLHCYKNQVFRFIYIKTSLVWVLRKRFKFVSIIFCTHTHTHTYACVCIYIYIYIYIYMCVCVCVCVCVKDYMYICIWVYIYIFTHTHTHTHIYIYIYINSLLRVLFFSRRNVKVQVFSSGPQTQQPSTCSAYFNRQVKFCISV